MSKVTSKLQVTVPKAVADRMGIRPGDRLEWAVAGSEIRVRVPGRGVAGLTRPARLALFDQATARIRRYGRGRRSGTPVSRGWTREELYTGGRAR
jgi:AbrB family looped-hinge helix DNA binding protein